MTSSLSHLKHYCKIVLLVRPLRLTLLTHNWYNTLPQVGLEKYYGHSNITDTQTLTVHSNTETIDIRTYSHPTPNSHSLFLSGTYINIHTYTYTRQGRLRHIQYTPHRSSGTFMVVQLVDGGQGITVYLYIFKST